LSGENTFRKIQRNTGIEDTDMSIQYEIDTILSCLDNIDDAFHLPDGEETEGEEFRTAKKVRELTTDITEKCFDLIEVLKTEG
jgi:hypothetical protein